MSSDPRVTVIVVACDRTADPERCLGALSRTRGAQIDVVVLAGRPPGGVAGELRFRWEQCHRRGLARTIRREVATSRGAYVALLAGHVEVEPGWLAPLLAALASDPAIAAACSTLVREEQPGVVLARGGRITWLGLAFDDDLDRLAADLEGEPACADTSFPTGAAMVMSLRDWEACGGFDPAFTADGADVDLGWRLWLLGRRVVVCRDSAVRARGSGLIGGERPHGWSSARRLRQTLRTLVKHYPPRFLLHALSWTVRSRLGSRAGGSLALAVLWNGLHLPATLVRRRWVQRRRVTRHEDLFAAGILLELADLPPRGALRRSVPQAPFAELIPSPVLLPATDSALGRLAAGWHDPEIEGGSRFRRTSGRAFCTLRVGPGARGAVRVSVRLPEGSDGESGVAVEVNGEAVEVACGGDGWRTVDAPAQADADGRLEVRISSPTGSIRPGGGPPRRSGCAVREVRFLEAEAPPWVPPATISIVVPTYNRWPILERTLAALACQTIREFEIVVVDDGSTDGTWEALESWRRAHPEVALLALHQENLKPGRARNRALGAASGDVVLFLGDDIIASPSLLAEHLAGHREAGHAVGVLGFTEWDRERMRVTPFLDFVNRDGQQFAYDHFRDGEDVPFTGFYTSNVSLPRRVLGAAPFDPAFTFVDWEDIELGYRLSRRGLRLIYRASARATHVHPSSVTSFYRRQAHVGRTIDVILSLHPELAEFAAMPPLVPRPWYAWARHLVPPLVPLIDRWDRAGLRLPPWLYRNVLLAAFWTGVAERGAARVG